MPRVEYVGKVISTEGITMSQKKIQSVLDFPLPETHKELKSALGLFNYFRDFIRGQSDIARPLHGLIGDYNKNSRNKKLNWNGEARIAFSHMQEMIANCPLLYFLQDNGQIVLETDASQYGVGAYLFQMVNNKELPIAFVSKSLNKSQLRWSVLQKEAYSIFHACMQLMYLLRDRAFLLRTDHKNLTFLHENSNPMVVRWEMALQELDKLQVWIPGSVNEISDAFSRLCHNKMERTVVTENQVSTGEINGIVSATLGTFRIPDADYKYISQCHNSITGHKGVEDTISKLHKGKIFFKYMRTKVKKFIRECPTCQKISASKFLNNASPFTTSSSNIMECINMDFLGPFHDGGYVLTVIDKFSRWVELYATDDATALSTAECLLNHFGRYGAPAFLQSDNGPHFIADVIKEFISMVGTEQFLTTAYSKEENAIVERMNKEVNRHLRALLFDRSTIDEYRTCLPLVMRIINSSVSVRTGFAASELLYGKALDLDRGIFVPVEERLPNQVPVSDYVRKLITLQNRLLEIAKSNLESSDAQHMRKNSKCRTEYADESYVLVRYSRGPPSRVHTLWRGPLRVVSSKQQHYTLYDLVVQKEKLFHVSNLKPFLFDPLKVDPLDIARRDYSEFFVDKIISHRGHTNRRADVQFLVRWLGYEEEDDTWEPYSFLRQVSQLHVYLTANRLTKLIPKEFRV